MAGFCRHREEKQAKTSPSWRFLGRLAKAGRAGWSSAGDKLIVWGKKRGTLKNKINVEKLLERSLACCAVDVQGTTAVTRQRPHRDWCFRGSREKVPRHCSYVRLFECYTKNGKAPLPKQATEQNKRKSTQKCQEKCLQGVVLSFITERARASIQRLTLTYPSLCFWQKGLQSTRGQDAPPAVYTKNKNQPISKS